METEVFLSKSPCHKSCNVKRSNLWATGVEVTACTRHGFFVPHSVVYFYKGEQYVATYHYRMMPLMIPHTLGKKMSTTQFAKPFHILPLVLIKPWLFMMWLASGM